MWFALIKVADIYNNSRSTHENGDDRWSVFVSSIEGFLWTTEGTRKKLAMKLKKNYVPKSQILLSDNQRVPYRLLASWTMTSFASQSTSNWCPYFAEVLGSKNFECAYPDQEQYRNSTKAGRSRPMLGPDNASNRNVSILDLITTVRRDESTLVKTITVVQTF